MKKLLAVLLALVMLVSLAACADNTDKDNPSSDAPANSDNPSILHTKRLQIECRGNISTGADSAQIFLKLPVRHRIPLATLLNVHHCVIRKAISADSDITSILHLRTDLISRRQPGIFIATLAVFNSSQTGV